MKFIIGTLLLIAMVNYFVVAQDRSPVKQTTNIGPGDWKEFRSNEGQLIVSFPGTPQTGVDYAGAKGNIDWRAEYQVSVCEPSRPHGFI